MHKPEWFWWTFSHFFIISLKTNKKVLWHEHSAMMSFFFLHMCPYKQRYIAGSVECSTKFLTKLLTYMYMLSAVKTGLQNYCDTSCSRDGVTRMWILKNSKDLLVHIQSRSLFSCNSIKTFNFSALYTTIPSSKLKDILRELVQLCFIKKNGQRRYKYQSDISYFA
jgi:hypothetical protein